MLYLCSLQRYEKAPGAAAKHVRTAVVTDDCDNVDTGFGIRDTSTRNAQITTACTPFWYTLSHHDNVFRADAGDISWRLHDVPRMQEECLLNSVFHWLHFLINPLNVFWVVDCREEHTMRVRNGSLWWAGLT